MIEVFVPLKFRPSDPLRRVEDRKLDKSGLRELGGE
jgi:hypothetical protein